MLSLVPVQARSTMLSLQLVMALMAWIISRLEIHGDQAGESLATVQELINSEMVR